MGNCQDSNYKAPNSISEAYLPEREKHLKCRHVGAILNLSSIDDKIISCSDDKAIAVSGWDLDGKGNQHISYLTGHTKAVNRVVGFKNSSNDLMCWSASRDLSIRCWNLAGKCVQTIEDAHKLNISAVTVDKDSNSVYSGSRDYSVKAWDAESGKLKVEFSSPRNIVTTMGKYISLSFT